MRHFAAAVIFLLAALPAGATTFGTRAVYVTEDAGVVHVDVYSGAVIPTHVDFTTVDGSALAGTRYTAVSGTLNFSSSGERKTIDIPIINDSLPNGVQVFSVRLFNPASNDTLYDNGIPSSSISVNISVIDDDASAVLNWAQSSYTFSEAVGNATLAVKRTGDMTQTVSAHYACGEPYMQTFYNIRSSGTVTFAPNETSKTVTCAIDDNGWTGDQMWYAELSDPLNANIGTNGIFSRIDMRVLEDDPIPALSIEDVTATEGNGPDKIVSIAVTLSEPVLIFAHHYWTTVGYAAQDGTARRGIDYDIYPDDLIFYPPQTKQTITVVLHGNNIPEPDKSFAIVLSTATCCGVIPRIAKGRCTFTIRNDDFIIEPANRAMPRGTIENLTVKDGVIDANDSIALISSNPDIVSVPASVPIAAAINRATVPVTALKDGTATITATMPASTGSAVLHSTITVFEPSTLVFDPQLVTMTAGSSTGVTVHISPLPGSSLTLPVAASDPSVVEVPSTVTIENTGFGTLTLKAAHTGTSLVGLTLPPSSGGATSYFRVQVVAAVPHITQVSPASGPTTGGASVTINGQNLNASCKAFFDGAAATQQTFASDSTMTAIPPPHSAGTVNVTISCEGAEAPERPTFTYFVQPSRWRGVRH